MATRDTDRQRDPDQECGTEPVDTGGNTDEGDARFMREAIELSLENVAAGRGGPFAAVVVKNGEIIARAGNTVTSSNDPTAHAEVNAIREACRVLGDFQLSDCDIYTTCEPCPMCLGAIYWARPRRVYYGASREDAAQVGFDDAMIYREIACATDERVMPMQQILSVEAQAAFHAWERKENRVDY